MDDIFTIRLIGEMNGEAIHPQTFDLSEAIKLLEGLVKSVRHEASSDGTKFNDQTRLLALESVADRCAEFKVAYTPLVAPAVERISAALSDENFDRLAAQTQRVVRETFGRLIEKGACVQFLSGRISPVYSKSHPLPIRRHEPSLIEDSVSLLAYIVTLGGKGNTTVKATFEATGETITVVCDKNLAKRMSDAGCLYETVSLVGKAEWKIEPWSLLSFRANDFEKHHKGTASELFGSFDRGFVDYFKDVDVDAFMLEVRGEDSK